MGDPLDGYATQVAPPTPPPAPNLNDLGALQVAPPTTTPAQMAKPAVKTATAAAAPPPGNKGGAGGSWGPEETTIGPAQEADRTELKQLKPGEKPRAGYDPLGGIREGIDKITEGIEAYNQQGRAEHPVLSRLGDVTREVKELLEGGQAAGKPLGTTSGLETNPVVQAIALAPEAAEWGEAAEGRVRAIPEYFKPKVSPKIAEAFDDAGAVEVAPPTKSVVDTTIAPHDFLKAVGANDGGAMSSEQVELYRDMIRKGSDIQPPVIEYDENGNIVGGDGRHRAMAYALENTERMPVRVHRQLAPEVAEESRYELNGDEGFTPAEALARRANELPLSNAIQNDFNHGGSWQRTRVHELSHAIVADDVGFDTGHMLSHLHPGMHPASQMAQEIIYEGGDNPLRATNPDGSFDKEEMGSRLFDVLKVHMAGAAGESEFYGMPYDSDEFKRATGGDLNEAGKLMDYLGVPKETRDKYLRSAFDGAKNILTNRNKQAILEGTAERAPGTADEYQMHEDNVHDLVNKVKGQNGQTKTDTTGHDEEAAGVGEESDAGREGDRALVTGRAVSKPKEIEPRYDLGELQPLRATQNRAANPAAESAQRFNEARNRPEIDHEAPPLDEERAKSLAAEMDAHEHEPNNPEVREAYTSLIQDVKDQWHHAVDDLGIHFEPSEKDPYDSYEAVRDDVKNNNRLKIFTGGNELPADHPLAATDPETGLTYNTMLRGVHDLFGHIAGDNDFSEGGEAGATHAHRQMMSEPSVPALLNETEGQVSQFFHGKNKGEFPPQNATVVPRDLVESGAPDWTKKATAAMDKSPAGGINPRTGQTKFTGVGSEIVPEAREARERLDHRPTQEDVRSFRDEHKDLFDKHPELNVGWDKTDQGWELNIGAVGTREGAMKVGSKLDQRAVWDIDKGEEIPTGGKGERTSFPEYPIEERLRDLKSESAAPEERYVHYSSEPIEGGVISGERRGEALAGSESARLQHENKVPGVYAYREGSEAENQIRSRSNKNTIVGNKNIADISGAQKEEFEAAHKEAFDRYKAEGDNDTMASQKALNDAEAHLRDAGYQGYEHVQGRPGTVFLFGDHPIEGVEGFKPSENRAPSMATDVIKNLYRNAPDYVAPVAGKPLEIPADVLTDDATTESTLHHEAAHAVLGSLRGADAYQIISHLHPDAAAEGFAAAADFDYRDWGGDASGNISHEAATERINDMMDMMAAGGVSDEHFHGIPWGENQGIRGDVRMMEKLMAAADVPEDDREAMIQAARDRATEVLTKPGVREIIQKHMNNRPEGLDESLHMDDEGIRAMTDEIKEHLNGNNTEDSRIHGSDNQENDARTEGQGEGESLRAEQKRKVKAAPEEEEKAPLEVAPGETISTRVPTAKKAVEDSMTHGLVIDSKAIYDNPELAKKMANEVRNYPGLKVPEDASDTQVLDAFKEHLKDNIKYVYDQTTPEEREAHGGWYEGANKFAADRAAEHDLTTAQGAGVLASMSPQKDWDMNASLAKRTMDIWDNKQSTKTTPEMMARGKQLASAKNSKGEYTNEAVRKLLPKIEGKKLKDLNPDLQALWIRMYDEAHNPREFNKINPDGSEGPLRTTMDGDPERVAWGSLSEIGKSVKILKDGSRDNISKSLGFSHKIRNFFNNIIEPNSPRQDLTADTHAVAAAQLRPLSGNSPEVKKNFGGIMHAMSGTKGTYALYADAYREAAKDLDISYARSLQSIIWEKIRSEFPSDIKSKENLGGIDSIWKEYTDGQISKREAQDAIFTAARGYRDQAFGGGGGASDQGKLFEPSVSGESTSGNGGGRGGNSTSGSLGKRGGVSKGAIDALSFINMMKSQKGASRTGAALMGAGIAGAGAVAALSGGNKEEEPQVPQPRPESRTVATEAPTDVHGLIKKASNDYGVPEAILHAQADQESKFNQDAVSRKGARGVMQLMPNTARSLNVDANDMAQNVDGGARLMSQLHHRFGSYDKALAAYNWSPDKVQDAIDTYGNDWLKHTPAETRNYVLRIMKNSR